MKPFSVSAFLVIALCLLLVFSPAALANDYPFDGYSYMYNVIVMAKSLDIKLPKEPTWAVDEQAGFSTLTLFVDDSYVLVKLYLEKDVLAVKSITFPYKASENGMAAILAAYKFFENTALSRLKDRAKLGLEAVSAMLESFQTDPAAPYVDGLFTHILQEDPVTNEKMITVTQI